MSKLGAAEWLFKIPYMWMVPAYSKLSKQSVETFGLHLTEDDDVNENMLNARETCQMTTVDAAVLFATSRPEMIVYDPDDAIIIYEKIMEHLREWYEYVYSPQLITLEIPIDGLREFNELAKILFMPANRHGYWKKYGQERDLGMELMTGVVENGTKVKFNDEIFKGIERKHIEMTKLLSAGASGGDTWTLF